MASGRTVRQVKHGERIRRSQTSLNPVAAPESSLIQNSDVARIVRTSDYVEVDGYGPYKPVPPPKPVSQQVLSNQRICLTPPPYRMPPYPLYNEPAIPGATGLDTPVATSSPAVGLHTHSSKFPIEREVILSNTDKNSKIPILNDYKKRNRGAVAPDIPPKQMAAWTQNHQNHQILSPDQTHPGQIQPSHQSDGPIFRASYNPPTDYYNGQITATGAVPRPSWHGGGGDLTKTTPRPYTSDDHTNSGLPVTVQIETSKESVQKEATKNAKSVTKTYHTIKDIISNRFKSNKENIDDNKFEETELNNVADELRKSQRNLGDDQEKKTAGEQGIYGKPRIDQNLPSIYSQHLMQQHIIPQQQYQTNPHMISHQQNSYTHQQQLMQARSQEMLAQTPRSDDLYYQTSYISSPKRIPNNIGGRLATVQQVSREQSLLQMQLHSQIANAKDDRRQPVPIERRSAQQIERDNLRQRSLDFRRAASHPHLAHDNDTMNEIPCNRPQPQAASNAVRRGSHGNIIESAGIIHTEGEKDSDDGGFLRKTNSRERRLEDDNKSQEVADDNLKMPDEAYKQNINSNSEEKKMADELQGTPRKRLEGEIGKIEGIYNVGQHFKAEDNLRSTKKNNPSSAASSDYDKAGGQSSSNADSGRGSAAYSSGRRPNGIDVEEDRCDSAQLTANSYRDIHDTGHDSEWVDVVENELRHILEPKLHELSLHGNIPGIANSTISDSVSSMTPPLPPLSPGDQSSPSMTPRNSGRFKHSSLPYGSKPDYDVYTKSKLPPSRDSGMNQRWHGMSHKSKSPKKLDHNAILRGKQSKFKLSLLFFNVSGCD